MRLEPHPSATAPETARGLANVTARELPVLEALAGRTHPGEFYSGFANLVSDTGLPRNEVRLRCRALKRKGLASFAQGLSDDDGQMAGAGYAITPAGRSALSAAAHDRGGERHG